MEKEQEKQEKKAELLLHNDLFVASLDASEARHKEAMRKMTEAKKAAE